MRTRGFSLVECMVAAVVLAIGLLAIVASEHAMQRLDLEGRTTVQAAEIGASRLAWLERSACLGASSGTAPGSLAGESWTLVPGPVARADVSITFVRGVPGRTVRFGAGFLCAAAP